MAAEHSQTLTNRICLVTGATSGIGEAAARGLAALGATVLVHGRDAGKGRRTVHAIIRETSNAHVRFVQGDLASLAEVRRLAAELDRSLPRVDVLLLNAGIACLHRAVTADGYETTFAVNHLAPFLLTHLLRAKLRASQDGRVVVVSSEAHRRMHLDFEDLMLEKDYGQFRAYGRSKLANLLFTRALARRLEGTGTVCNALHPGVVRTGIFRDAPALVRGILATIARPLLLSPERGARTSLHLASAPEAAGRSGEYYIRCKPARPSAAALDDVAAERLWDTSARLVGVAAA
ncbi:MAG: SDR family oxidoreductase [Steroidobacteraceae bacterium]